METAFAALHCSYGKEIFPVMTKVMCNEFFVLDLRGTKFVSFMKLECTRTSCSLIQKVRERGLSQASYEPLQFCIVHSVLIEFLGNTDNISNFPLENTSGRSLLNLCKIKPK